MYLMSNNFSDETGIGNSIYDVADGVRKRIIRSLEGNVYYEAQCYMTRKQAVSGRIIEKEQDSRNVA
jgi:hypothetical protein